MNADASLGCGDQRRFLPQRSAVRTARRRFSRRVRAVEFRLTCRGTSFWPETSTTNHLKHVAVEPEDLNAITAGMTRCSTYTGHDGAMVATVAPPSLDEMTADIDAFEAWRKLTVERQKRG